MLRVFCKTVWQLKGIWETSFVAEFGETTPQKAAVCALLFHITSDVKKNDEESRVSYKNNGHGPSIQRIADHIFRIMFE